MIDHVTLGTIAAHARARVHTLVADTRAVTRAIRTDHALQPTACGERRAEVAGQTGALGGSVDDRTDGVQAALGGRARVAVFGL